jgi:ArsR family transcriptional regulator
MASILKALRLLADANRIRILLLLTSEELSVAELQEILGLGQSTISTQLSQLKTAGLIEDRRAGKNNLYRLQPWAAARLLPVMQQVAAEIPETAQDQAALQLALRKRQDKSRAFFDEMAGRFGREYVPGRSWKGLAEALLKLMPPLVIADLGAGEATFSLLLAQRAKQVIAVDSSPKMVEFGANLARKQGVRTLECRLGDLEMVPIEDAGVDLALFSQSLHHALHPERAVAEAWRILKPGGRIVVLDLVKHRFEEARELYADVWLGFGEAELQELLHQAGFANLVTDVVHREEAAPYFETLLAVGDKR